MLVVPFTLDVCEVRRVLPFGECVDVVRDFDLYRAVVVIVEARADVWRVKHYWECPEPEADLMDRRRRASIASDSQWRRRLV